MSSKKCAITQAIFFRVSQLSWWYAFEEVDCAEKTGEKHDINSLASSHNHIQSAVIGSCYSKCYLGVYVLLVNKLLYTICQSIDLFSNDVSLKYIFYLMDTNANFGIYVPSFVIYITFLLIKTRARPDRDGGLAEADAPKRTK